ncbi:Demethylrebeccamycin-D-glucose O-methyltransferase [compost metagenome]
MSESGYILKNADAAAATRLDVLASIFDPWTRAHLVDCGLAAGWRCWEVGAGGPNTVRWLAERVGPTGHVLATDLDPRWAAAAVGENVTVLTHDVTDPPPEDGFDLIHARLVLTHVPERERALSHMVGALRPGGWLVIEDADPDLLPLSCLDGPEEARELANRLRAAFRSMLAARGGTLSLGRRLPGLLSGQGLTDVRAEAYFAVAHPSLGLLDRLTYDQVGQALVAAGLATEEEIARHVDNVSRGLITPLMAPLITAWGRKERPLAM